MAKTESKGFFRRIGGVLEGLRRFLVNLFFLLFLVILVVVFFAARPEVPERAALVLEPRGTVVEQLGPFDPIAELSGNGTREALLANLIDALDRGREDPRIEMAVLELNELDHIGVSKSIELGRALERFRAAGKAVVANADSYDQDQYFLAVHADEIYLNSMGAVVLEGFGVFRNYFRRALEKLSIEFHLFKVGEYKSALEPLVRDDMSEQAKEANRAWLDQLWGLYTATVTERRGIDEESLSRYVNQIDQVLAEHGGDAAAAAVSSGLVDDILSRADLEQLLISRVGEDDEGRFNRIGHREYLSLTRPTQPAVKQRVGVIVASGLITEGEQPPGMIGGDSLSQLIRQAREDEDIKAVVLRVDSGGGSAVASEVIRSELLRLKASGKPLVVSMGSTAASGGYWIAANADEIWATPATLTGSIGIFGAIPTIDRALGELGISTDGVGTTEVAGGLRIDRPLNPVVERAIQAGVEHGYRQFLEIVAGGRDMLVEQVEPIAQGRVWTGTDARELGLVDRIGGLDEAVKSAAALAGLSKYRVERVQQPMTPAERLLRQLMGVSSGWWPQSDFATTYGWLVPVLQPLRDLTMANDPRRTYAYCATCLAP